MKKDWKVQGIYQYNMYKQLLFVSKRYSNLGRAVYIVIFWDFFSFNVCNNEGFHNINAEYPD